MSWWRTHWRLGIALIAGGAGVILLFVLLLLRQKKVAEQLRGELAMMKTTAKVAGLEADKEARKIELITNREKGLELDKKIIEAKRATVAVVKEVDGLSDADVIAEFNELEK